jgi:hypothetical protein
MRRIVGAVADLAWGVCIAWSAVISPAVGLAAYLNARWLRQRAPRGAKSEMTESAAFLLVIPTLGESELEETVASVARLVSSDELTVSVLVVAAAHDVLKTELKRRIDRLTSVTTGFTPKLVSCPGPRTDKRALLAYAWSIRPRTHSDAWLVVIDCDTVVGPDLLVQLRRAAYHRRGTARALQPLVLSRPPAASGALAWAEAVMHSRWRLGYELTLLRLADSGGETRRAWAPLSYAVGCCLALDHDSACELGARRGTDDLDIGYGLSVQGRVIAAVPSIAVTRTKGGPALDAERHAAWFSYSARALQRLLREDQSRRVWILLRLEQLRLIAWTPAAFVVATMGGLQTLGHRHALRRVALVLLLNALANLSSVPTMVSADLPASILPPAGERLRASLCCIFRPVWSNAIPGLLLHWTLR